MSERIHGLAQLLPDKSSLDDYTLEELQHVAKRYPFFAPVQFLLLQKMKEAALPETAAQQQKAALYYTDPLLFDYFISPNQFATDEKESELTKEEVFNSEAISEIVPADEETVMDKPILLPPQNENDRVEEGGFVVEEPNSETHSVIVPESAVAIDNHSHFSEPFPESDKVTLTDYIETGEPVILPAQDVRQDSFDGAYPEVTEAEAEPTHTSVLPPTEASVADEVAPVNVIEEELADNRSLQNEHPNTKTEEKTAVVVADQSPETSPAQEPLAFEPFHTVDYFASQGIRIKADELPKDKLSKQLRSFTEWLRIMKRLPAAEVAQSPETVAEKSVESLASHSVEGTDVVTEAMAEVWARQGNRQKAIETYNKLSLLNPSKKAYFADKIQNLKRS